MDKEFSNIRIVDIAKMAGHIKQAEVSEIIVEVR